jgi:hypothetical protein
LAARTGGNALLKLIPGHGCIPGQVCFEKPLNFHRNIESSEGRAFVADNNNGQINVYHGAFEFGGTHDPAWLLQVILHEIGHNWDDENPRWNDFLALSGWRNTRPFSTAGYVETTEYDQTWWRLEGAAFARDYGAVHPVEDFATAFAAYFTDYAGWQFRGGPGAAAIPAKMQLIDAWLGAGGAATPESLPGAVNLIGVELQIDSSIQTAPSSPTTNEFFPEDVKRRRPREPGRPAGACQPSARIRWSAPGESGAGRFPSRGRGRERPG